MRVKTIVVILEKMPGEDDDTPIKKEIAFEGVAWTVVNGDGDPAPMYPRDLKFISGLDSLRKSY
jgi:hypothetical protein